MQSMLLGEEDQLELSCKASSTLECKGHSKDKVPDLGKALREQGCSRLLE